MNKRTITPLEPALLSVADAALVLGMSTSKAYELIDQGYLVAVKHHGTTSKKGWKVKPEEIQRYKDSLDEV